MTPLLLLLCTQALSTDRPTTAYSAEVVSHGSAIIESGVDYANGPRAFSLPTSIRFGVDEFVEIRVDTTFATITTDGDVAGGEVSPGFKAHLTDNDGLLPSSGLLVNGTFTTSGELHISSRFLLLATWALPWGFSGSINAGLSWVFEDKAGDGTQIHYVVGIGRAIFGALGGFVGTSGFFNCDGTRDHAVRTGLVYLLNDDFQLDVFGRFDLQQTENVTVGSGLGVRF